MEVRNDCLAFDKETLRDLQGQERSRYRAMPTLGAKNAPKMGHPVVFPTRLGEGLGDGGAD
jgi:hypothetical protein